MTLLRFVQFDVAHEDVHGNPDGVPLPADCEGWEPFQVEIRNVPRSDGVVGSDPSMIRLAVWLRKLTPA